MRSIKALARHRTATSIALTAGLVLAGVTTASASSSAEHGTQAGKGKEGKRICVIVHKGDKGEKTTTEVRGDKVYVNGKRVPHGKAVKCTDLPGLPGKPGHGKHICVIVHKDGKGDKGDKVTAPSTTAASAAGATQVSNGKPPKGEKCPLPPLPGKPGHGKHVCVFILKDGKGEKGDKTTTEARDSKLYVNGDASKGKLPKCPPLPGKPGQPGKGGSTGGK